MLNLKRTKTIVGRGYWRSWGTGGWLEEFDGGHCREGDKWGA